MHAQTKMPEASIKVWNLGLGKSCSMWYRLLLRKFSQLVELLERLLNLLTRHEKPERISYNS